MSVAVVGSQGLGNRIPQGYVRMVEKTMKTTITLGLYTGCIGIMENKMETTI